MMRLSCRLPWFFLNVNQNTEFGFQYMDISMAKVYGKNSKQSFF